MYTYPGVRPKQKLSRPFLAGLLLAIGALAWSAYRAGQPQPPAGPGRETASSPGPALNPARPVAPDASIDAYRTAGYDELLGLLRRKLSEPGGEVWAALAEIAQSRPALALALAQELGRTAEEKSAWATDLMKQWTLHDPKDAWDWLTQPDNKLTSNALVGTAMDAMAVSDPEMLLGTVDMLLLGNDTSGSPFSAQNSVYMGLQALIKSGNINLARAAVEAWAKDPLKLSFGTGAYDIVALAMDKSTPETTAAWLKSLPSSEERNSAMANFASTWSQSDPAAAMHWAESIPAEEGQSDTIGQIFSGWMQADPVAAMNWLDDYIPRSAGLVQDDVLIGSMILFSPTTKGDPGEAMKLADEIVNPQARSIYQQQVVQSWGRTDPGAAVEYILNSTTISKEQKELLIQQIQDSYKAANSPNPPEQ